MLLLHTEGGGRDPHALLAADAGDLVLRGRRQGHVRACGSTSSRRDRLQARRCRRRQRSVPSPERRRLKLCLTTKTPRVSAGLLFLPILVPAIHRDSSSPVYPSSSSCGRGGETGSGRAVGRLGMWCGRKGMPCESVFRLSENSKSPGKASLPSPHRQRDIQLHVVRSAPAPNRTQPALVLSPLNSSPPARRPAPCCRRSASGGPSAPRTPRSAGCTSRGCWGCGGEGGSTRECGRPRGAGAGGTGCARAAHAQLQTRRGAESWGAHLSPAMSTWHTLASAR